MKTIFTLILLIPVFTFGQKAEVGLSAGITAFTIPKNWEGGLGHNAVETRSPSFTSALQGTVSLRNWKLGARISTLDLEYVVDPLLSRFLDVFDPSTGGMPIIDPNANGDCRIRLKTLPVQVIAARDMKLASFGLTLGVLGGPVLVYNDYARIDGRKEDLYTPVKSGYTLGLTAAISYFPKRLIGISAEFNPSYLALKRESETMKIMTFSGRICLVVRI